MARFFVGQRVKKARGINGIGTTGRYVCDDPCPFDDFDCWIACDTSWMGNLGVLNPASETAFCASHQWEPITPDGHRAGDYITFRDLMDSLEGVRA